MFSLVLYTAYRNNTLAMHLKSLPSYINFMSGKNMFNGDFFFQPVIRLLDISKYLIFWPWRYKLWPIWPWLTHQHLLGGMYWNCWHGILIFLSEIQAFKVLVNTTIPLSTWSSHLQVKYRHVVISWNVQFVYVNNHFSNRHHSSSCLLSWLPVIEHLCHLCFVTCFESPSGVDALLIYLIHRAGIRNIWYPISSWQAQ